MKYGIVNRRLKYFEKGADMSFFGKDAYLYSLAITRSHAAPDFIGPFVSEERAIEDLKKTMEPYEFDSDLDQVYVLKILNGCIETCGGPYVKNWKNEWILEGSDEEN